VRAILLAGLLLLALAPAHAADAPLPRIAVLDSGIDASHPEFAAGQVVAWRDFVGGRAEPYDDHGHGTATASLAAGQNVADCSPSAPKLSFAPGAPLVVAKVLTSTNGLPSRAMLADAIDWAVAQDARVISISIGSSSELRGKPDARMAAALQRAHDADVLVVVSAGNGVGTAGVSGVSWPSWTRFSGNFETPLVVGKALRGGQSLAQHGHTDPDLASWGASVCAATLSGGVASGWTGSSFAAPLVAGIGASAIAAADAHGQPSDPAHVKRLLLLSARNAPEQPYASEGLGFLLEAEAVVATAHAAAGTLPDYAAQGPHTLVDLAYHELKGDAKATLANVP
jgi:subtilisin